MCEVLRLRRGDSHLIILVSIYPDVTVSEYILKK